MGGAREKYWPTMVRRHRIRDSSSLIPIGIAVDFSSCLVQFVRFAKARILELPNVVGTLGNLDTSDPWVDHHALEELRGSFPLGSGELDTVQ